MASFAVVSVDEVIVVLLCRYNWIIVSEWYRNRSTRISALAFAVRLGEMLVLISSSSMRRGFKGERLGARYPYCAVVYLR